MRTEDYLQMARDIKFRVDYIERELSDIESDMYIIKSSSDYQEMVQSSPRQDALENQVIKIIEHQSKLEIKLKKERARLRQKRDEIQQKISRMKEGQSRRFLMDYYIECKNWQQIMDEYKYLNPESVYILKNRAIKDFDKFYKKNKNTS